MRPGIGVGVFICNNNNTILMSYRKVGTIFIKRIMVI